MNLSLYAYYLLPALAISAVMVYVNYRKRAYQKIHEFIDPFTGEKKEKRDYYKKEIIKELTLFCFRTERFARQKIDSDPTLRRYIAPYKLLLEKTKSVREDLIIDVPTNLPSLLSIFQMDRIRNDKDLQALYEEWCTYEDLVTSYHTIFRFSLT
jgi:hypothetical protein